MADPASTIRLSGPPRRSLPLRPESPGAALAVGLGGALALALLSALVRHEPTPRGDDLIYERMAIHPFGVHTFPFGYRIGLPFLVHILPMGTTAGFRLLAWVAAGGAAAFAYLLMCRLGSRPSLAAALATLMCVSPPFLLVAIRQGRNPDIATVLFLTAGAYFVVRGDPWKLAVTLLIGVVFREAVLFIVPLAYSLWARSTLDRRAAVRTLLIALPAIAAYAGLRAGVQTVGETQVPGYAGSLIGERLHVIRDGLRTALREARRIATIYGPLWLISPLALRDMSYARRGLVLVALSVLAMSFALDWGRMILLSAPVFYPASAHVLTGRPRWILPTLATMLALVVGYAIYMDHSGVQSGIVNNGMPPYPVR